MPSSDSHFLRLARQFGWLFVSRILGALLQAVIFIVMARIAGVRDFGILAAALGILLALSAALDFGVGAYLTKTRAESRDSPMLRGALGINRWSAVALMVVTSVMFIVLGFFVDEVYFLLIPLAASTAAEKMTDGLLALAIADGDTLENTYSILLRRSLCLALLLALANVLNPLLAYAIAQLMASGVGLIVAAKRLSKRVQPGVSVTYRAVLHESWPFWVNTALAQVRNLDAAILAIVTNPVVAGIYAVPSRLTAPLRIIPTTLAQVALPAASRGHKDEIRALIRAISIVMLLMTAILGAVAAAAPLLVQVLGSDYEEAAVPLQILCVGLIFASAASFMNSILQGRGLAKVVALVSTVTGLYSLGAVAAGGVAAGAVGATAGLASSFLLQAVLLIAPTIRVLQERKPGTQ